MHATLTGRADCRPIRAAYCSALFKEENWIMILDLHDFRGNVYGAMDTPMPLLTEPTLKEHFLTVWSELSRHLKGYGNQNSDEIVIAFELLNEVSDASHYLWGGIWRLILQSHRISICRDIIRCCCGNIYNRAVELLANLHSATSRTLKQPLNHILVLSVFI